MSQTVGDVRPVSERLASALHVTNGDCTDLGGTGLAERILVWVDVLHEGPVPLGREDELRRVRADFLASEPPGGPVDRTVAEQIHRRLAERDFQLAANRHGDYVLWFEADLYDQLQICQILDRLGELEVAPEQVTLICIGEHPGVAHFGGLGQLEAAQLRALPDREAAPLSAGALALARRVWAAVRAPDPGELSRLAGVRSVELRFLGEALDRLSREYPSTRDGLSLGERRILAAVAGTDGPVDAAAAFARVAAREARPYLGDAWCFATMARLVGGTVPLLATDRPGAPVDGSTRLTLTEAGARVLDGRGDHVALNGIDRWIGGVHLIGRRAAWRFHEGTETIVAAG